MTDDPLKHFEYMTHEHEAWLRLVAELRRTGAGEIEAGGRDERLHDAIVAWGEELAQLRLHDPDLAHAERALAERRERWERWT